MCISFKGVQFKNIGFWDFGLENWQMLFACLLKKLKNKRERERERERKIERERGRERKREREIERERVYQESIEMFSGFSMVQLLQPPRVLTHVERVILGHLKD